MSLPSSRYFRLAPLLVSYGGALAAAIRRDYPNGLNDDPQPSPTTGAPANPHVASSAIPTYEGATLAAMTEGPGEFPGIEYSGG